MTIRRSKTDQEGAGQVVAIVRGHKACPVHTRPIFLAFEDWCRLHGLTVLPALPVTVATFLAHEAISAGEKSGRVINGRLTPHSVGLIVKRHAESAGFDPALFSGHSLRAGFLTSAAARGAPLFKMMEVSRHRRADTLRIYIRDAEAFKDHAGAGLL